MKDDIDSLFRKAFQEEQAEPPVYLWEQITQQLEKRKRRRKWLLWSYPVAASLFLLVGLSTLFSLPENNFTKEEAQTVCAPYQVLSSIKVKLPLPLIAENISAIHTFPSASLPEKTSFQYTRTLPPASLEQIQKITNNTPLPYYNIKTPSIRKSIIPLINKNAYALNSRYQKLLLAENELSKKETSSSKNKLKLSVSGHFSPGYASGNYKQPVSSLARNRYTSDQLEGIFSVSGGIKVSVSANKRISFQTGILYTRLGQHTEGNNVYIPRQAVLSATNMHASPSLVYSPLGPIKSKANAFVYRAESAVLLGAKAKEGNIEQVFGAIEIPLAVKYRLNLQKLNFNLLGGFSGSFIVSNKAYLDYGNKREFMGSTEDIRTFNVSADFGIGMEYALSQKVKILLEPGFRYYLQSISENKDVNFKPYLFSFSTGIGIDF